MGVYIANINLRLLKIAVISVVCAFCTHAQTINYRYNPKTGFLEEAKTENTQFRYQYDALGNRTSTSLRSDPEATVDLLTDSLLTSTNFYTEQPTVTKIELQNLGSDAAKDFYLAIYLSRDRVLDEKDTLINKKYLSLIDANQQATIDLNLTIPYGFETDSTYLIFFADNTYLISEQSESNNLLVVPISVLPSEYQQDQNQANFSADIQYGCSGTEVQFTDLTPNEAFEWSWVFYGGSPGFSSEQNPKVVYHTEGDFPVTLTVSNEDGTFTKTFQNQIDISDSPVLLVDNIPDQLDPKGGRFELHIDNPCGANLNWFAQIISDNPWLSIEGDFSGNQPGNLVFTYPPSVGFPNKARIIIRADESKNKEVAIDVVQGVELTSTQTIRLDSGWNFVSFYTYASGTTIDELVKDISSVVNEVRKSDQSYFPINGSNPFLVDPLSAYWIHIDKDITWQIEGSVLKPEDHPIQLKKGKNLVTFLGQPKRVKDALVSLGDQLIRVKTALTNYAPNYGILNSMDFMIPGQGYEIEVEEDVILTYPKDN